MVSQLADPNVVLRRPRDVRRHWYGGIRAIVEQGYTDAKFTALTGCANQATNLSELNVGQQMML